MSSASVIVARCSQSALAAPRAGHVLLLSRRTARTQGSSYVRRGLASSTACSINRSNTADGGTLWRKRSRHDNHGQVASNSSRRFCSSTRGLGSTLSFKSIVEGKDMLPEEFEGKAVLVVNTASLCGLTPQLKELQLVHKRFEKDGLIVLGVPSNDFGAQEPWEEEKILEFYKKDFGVTFPVTSKTAVVGPDAHPLYKAAVAGFGSEVGPQWNFHKILVGPAGDLVGVFSSHISPLEPDVTEAIEEALPSKVHIACGEQETTVIIDFHAVWCGPCKRIGPYLEELAGTMKDVVFLKVDVDNNSDAAEKYEIEAMPTFKIVKGGNVITTITGADEASILAALEQHK